MICWVPSEEVLLDTACDIERLSSEPGCTERANRVRSIASSPISEGRLDEEDGGVDPKI